MNEKMRISVSVEGYENKEQTKVALAAKGKNKMSWVERDITIEDFVRLATSGHSFCHLFRQNGNKPLRLTQKTKKNFVGAQAVFVDVDETQYETFGEFVDTLPIHPQIVYSSYSDCAVKNGLWSRRFHLVFCFDRIMDFATYGAVASYLYDMIEENTNEAITDKCGLSPVQYMNGCNGGEYSLYSFSLISLNEVLNEACNGSQYSHNISLMSQIDDAPKFTTVSHAVRDSITEFTDEAMTEFRETCHFQYYWDNSENDRWIYTSVTINEKTVRCAYQFVDTATYCSLFYNHTRIKDGEKRRKKLYQRALMRRWFRPTVTPNELFFNWVVDVMNDCEIDDDLTVENAVKNVEKVMSLSMIELEERVRPLLEKGIENRGNKIGVIFRFPHTLTNGERQTAKGQIHREIVRATYDVEKNVDENREILANSGIFLDKRTIYRYVGDLIDQRKKDVETMVKGMYNPNMSLDKNVELAKAKGINISRNTLKRIVNGNAA